MTFTDDDIAELLADLRAIDPAKADKWEAHIEARRRAMRAKPIPYRSDPDSPEHFGWFRRAFMRVFDR